MLEKNIELNDVVKVCERYLKKEMSKIEFELFTKGINVISYMPLVEKTALLYVINYHPNFNNNSFDSVMIQSNLELLKLFKILLAYTNINTEDYNEKIFSEQNYDLLYESGLADIILKKCQKDYDKTISMLMESISLNSVLNLNEIVGSLNTDIIEQGLDSMKYFQDEMSEEDKDRIIEVMKSNDPTLKMLKEQIERIAIDEVNNKK